jgi:hypothetical protein
MRHLLWTMCAVALVSCSDAHSPSVTAPSLKHAPAVGHEDPGFANNQVDARTVPGRIADLIGSGFERVTLPADTFSRSADAVHPDIACPPDDWNGARCWLMYTPYKNSDPSYENPGFLKATSDVNWVNPPSIINPIVAYPGIGAYNSDPDHAFDPGNKRLVQVYRVVSDSFNKIMIMSTLNAKPWTTPQLAFKERNHDAVSPSLVIDPDRSASLWYVRAGATGCNSSSSSVQLRTATPAPDQRLEQATWSAPQAVSLSIPNSVVWHLDVAALPGSLGYVALVVAYQKGLECGFSDLWLATSEDGIQWQTYPVPILWRGMKLARDRSINTWYRGTLRYDDDTGMLHIWPSGLAGTSWQIYHTAVPLQDLLALLRTATSADLKFLSSAQVGIHAALSMP